MTPEDYTKEGHVPYLKAFLDSPAGKALLEVMEDYGKPSNESRKQYGSAEDVKLQMSLNYVAMEQTFAVVKMVKGLVKITPNRATKPIVPVLVDEDTPREKWADLGIPLPTTPIKVPVKPPEPVVA